MSEFSGSKTMANGTRVRMDPAEAKALWEAVMAAKAKDEAMMPDSAAAILLLSRAPTGVDTAMPERRGGE